MKEYSVIESIPTKAEDAMNEMAREGWIVKAVTFWENYEYYSLVITFERDAQ